MSLNKKIEQRLKRRAYRVKNGQLDRGKKFRISVFRSINNIYAQIVDDSSSVTVLSFSSLNLESGERVGDKKAVAKAVGVKLGKMAVDKSIVDVFFDRGRFIYHGRVKALAEGLREAGLKF